MISLISILKFYFFDLDFKVQWSEVSILKFGLDHSVVSGIIKEIHHYPSLTNDVASEQARPPHEIMQVLLWMSVNFFLFRSELGVDICVHTANFDSNPMAQFRSELYDCFFSS